MRSGISPSPSGIFSISKYPVKKSLPFIFLLVFVFQGCVIHQHGRGHRSYVKPAPVTFTFDNHHRHTVRNYYQSHPRHYHGNRHDPRRQWKYKRKAYFPRGKQMQVIPVGLARQLPPAPRGTRYIYHDDQILLINVSTRLVLDFINIPVSAEHRSAYNQQPAPKIADRMPSYEDQRASHRHLPPPHARSHEVAKGKPFTEDRHPSSHGQEHKPNRGNAFGKHQSHDDRDHRDHEQVARKGPHHDDGQHPISQSPHHKMKPGKPDKGKDHSSIHGQDNKGSEHPRGKDHEPPHAKKDKGDHPRSVHPGKDKKFKQDKEHPDSEIHTKKENGRPDKDHKEHPSSHARQEKDVREVPPGNRESEPNKGRDHRPEDRGKHAFENPVNGDSDSNQKHAGKRQEKKKDKKQREKKSKQKNRTSDLVEQQPSLETAFFTPEENVQVAKAEPGRNKDRAERKSKKDKSRKHKQQIEDATPATPPLNSESEPAQPEITTASLTPATFDNRQRTLIQNYFQNSNASSSSKGKGRGKSAIKSKKNKPGNVARNDIFKQPIEPLPRDLESQLPPPPPNTVRGVYNHQVLLVENETRKVLDVIDWDR